MAELIASSTSAATSADITVVAGTPATIFLKSATSEVLPSDGSAQIQIKSSNLTYYVLGSIDRVNPAKVIDGPGTYRIVKTGSASTAFGVDQS